MQVSSQAFFLTKCKFSNFLHLFPHHTDRHKTGDFFKCDVFQCNYSCRTLMALKRHDAREHLGQPAFYLCHIYGCNKKFLRGYLLTKHLKADHDFTSPPGHSRFIYKQEEDGFYRLQTKRVENLKETKVTKGVKDNFEGLKISYEIDSIDNLSDRLNVNLRQVSQDVVMKADKKDINEFAIVKNYNKLIGKNNKNG